MEEDETANMDNFIPMFIIGKYNGLPACTTANSKESVNPTEMTGMLVALTDYIISRIPENVQVEVEQYILENFQEMLENRHEFTLKVDILPEDM